MPLVSRVRTIQSSFANRCGSVPFPTEVVQSIQHVQAMTQRKRRAHLYSTRELCSTHVPREEEEEDEEKNTAWLSHRHGHRARPRKIEPGSPSRTALWVLLCACELSKLPTPVCGPYLPASSASCPSRFVGRELCKLPTPLCGQYLPASSASCHCAMQFLPRLGDTLPRYLQGKVSNRAQNETSS